MAVYSEESFHERETWPFRGTVNDETGAPLDISSATVTLRIESTDFIAAPVDAVAGVWEAIVGPNDQAPFTSTRLSFEVRVVFASGVVTVQNYGTIKVRPSLSEASS